MHKNCAAATATSGVALHRVQEDAQTAAGDHVPLDAAGELSPTPDNFDILCRSMERLFKAGPKPVRYKVSAVFFSIPFASTS